MTNITAANENIGLCSTCNYNDNCSTRKSFKGEILHCEEFDDYIPQQILTEEKANEEKSPVQYAPLNGLCLNCDLVSTCTLPKHESGVWFCNEYK
ncbi:MAG: hypothetical protein NT175_02855 [Bacteroidetes bacterium]|nr:hypothetical protein [Bacteroidota bacterium]